MIGNLLLFLGCVLIIFPTWLLIGWMSNGKGKSTFDLKEIFVGKPKEANPLLTMVRAFQLWGGFWLVSGTALKLIGNPVSDGPIGTLIYAFIFLLPIVLITLIGIKNRNNNI